jgi:hypothetical protein
VGEAAEGIAMRTGGEGRESKEASASAGRWQILRRIEIQATGKPKELLLLQITPPCYFVFFSG